MSTTTTAAVTPTEPAKPAPGNGAKLGELQRLLETHKDQIAMALPRHMTPERMIRVAMTAYSTTPALHECTSVSIAACIVQASILGLEPNSVLGESYLIPFNRKIKEQGKADRWIKECQLMVGYQGLLKLVRQSGELMMVNAQAVREKDDFDFEDGLDPYLRHKRAPGTPEERGPVVAYWAGAVLRGGGKQFVVLTVPEIIAIRDKYSKGWEQQKQNSTWGKEFDAMALKTCIRRLCKYLPKSIEKDHVSAAVNLDERAESGLVQRFMAEVPLSLHSSVDEEDGGPEPEVIMPKRLSEIAKDAGMPTGDAAAKETARADKVRSFCEAGLSEVGKIAAGRILGTRLGDEPYENLAAVPDKWLETLKKELEEEMRIQRTEKSA